MSDFQEKGLIRQRVLDLTDEKGFLCGKLLADLGADVIKVEKPGGEPSRNIGPFYHGIPDPESSLYWYSYSTNKRSITLNIESEDGKNIFKQLVSGSDFVIESTAPGYLDNLGLGYNALSKVNPRIILTSITPFGQEGPYSAYQASDLTLMAMGGFSYLIGYPGMAPLRISIPQSWLLGGSQAAASTMIAHYYRETTGEGQHVDVSIQACIAWSITTAVPYWFTTKANRFRPGIAIDGWATVRQRNLWPCKDGFVTYILLGGRMGSAANAALVKWMDEEGMADEYIKHFKWDEYDLGTATQEQHDRLEAYFAEFFLRHTKAELYGESDKRGTVIYPVCSPKDIVNSAQLKARDVWSRVEYPELNDTIEHPEGWFRTTEFRPQVRQRPPLIGEHNLEVYQELGLSKNEISSLKQANII